jgi:2-oxoglutarate dehydrogenase E2 component (dihydrolipoamide succinyltransferase)
MSLEAKIEALTAAVVALTAKMESSNVAPAAPVAQVVVAPVPVAAPAPVAAAPAPVMPAPPTFVAPAPVAAAPAGVPFADGKGLIDYVMGAYKALGPQKGAQIQGVLTGLGYQNINDVKPEHYGALHHGIEALKA